MGNMRTCPSCSTNISKQADSCPNCGHTFKSNRHPILKLGCLLLLIIGAAGFGFVALCSKAVVEVSEKHNKEEKEGVAFIKAQFETTASQICSDYSENELAATNKYKGAIFKITGTLESINTSFGDKVILYIGCNKNKYSLTNIHAWPAANEYKKIALLKKGDQVTLKCKGDSEVAGSPMLKMCVIVQ